MPTYLCHGFRWHRRSIRIFVILNDLEDCAPDWIIGRTSASLILSQFGESFDFVPRLDSEEHQQRIKKKQLQQTKAESRDGPQYYDDDFSIPPPRITPSEDNILAHAWSPVKLLEEYDMSETEHAARPYAYVADYVVRVDLSADIAAEMAKYAALAKERDSPWFDKLRDQVQPGEEMRWYMVVCDDGDREAPLEDDDDEGDLTETEDGRMTPHRRGNSTTDTSSQSERPSTGEDRVQSRGESGKPKQSPEFLNHDPYKSDNPQPSRLRRKLSLRRLFKKDP